MKVEEYVESFISGKTVVYFAANLTYFYFQGQTLARDSEISERDMTARELTFPEVHGQGANDD